MLTQVIFALNWWQNKKQKTKKNCSEIQKNTNFFSSVASFHLFHNHTHHKYHLILIHWHRHCFYLNHRATLLLKKSNWFQRAQLLHEQTFQKNHQKKPKKQKSFTNKQSNLNSFLRPFKTKQSHKNPLAFYVLTAQIRNGLNAWGFFRTKPKFHFTPFSFKIPKMLKTMM